MDEEGTRRGRSVGEVKLQTDFPHYAKYRKSIFYEGPRLWRSLPADIKAADNLSVFKNKLTKHY